MKKFIAILCTIMMFVGTVSVSGATASDGDKDGDVITNPWADLFTTAENGTDDMPIEPEIMDMTACIKDDAWHENGGYSYYVGSSWGNSSAQMAVDPEDEDHVQIQQLTSDWSQAWTLQLKKIVSGLTSGETYTLKIDVYATLADGTIRVSGDVDHELVAGTQNISIQATANDEGTVEFVAGLGWVGLTNVLDFSNPVVYDANGNVVYPGDGENPTDTPTTVAGETTAKTDEITTVPETQKPTGNQATTVTPTTTQKEVVVKVKKSKVKKATKKKSSKKAKISIKKIKGAKYQIQISKAKKFKKKNILVKKNVKKVKFTIKSKKIKNKKKLYVRVRAYKVVNGKKYYSKWSKAKKVKIKK